MKKAFAWLLAGLLFLFIVYALLHDFDRDSDVLFYNGEILTMQDSSLYAEAVYVQHGKIIAVGDKDAVFMHRNNNTKLVDLHGKTLMPGFIDAHGHLDVATIYYDMLDVSGFKYKKQAEVWAAVSKQVKQSKPGAWIFCHGLDPILTKDLRSPTRTFLDSIAPENPLVLITQALHTFYANTKAFDAVGIDNQTINPTESSYYARDAQGNLNGQIIEQEAFEPFRQIIKDISKKTFLQNTQKQLHKNAQKGITTTVTMGVLAAQKPLLMLYQHLSGERATFIGNMMQFVGLFPDRRPNPRHFIYLRKEDDRFLPDNPNRGDDFYKILGVKFWYDGSPYSGSMYLKEPYAHSHFIGAELGLDSLHRGEGLYTPEQFRSTVTPYLSKGWKIAVHSQGDQAVEEVMASFKAINKEQNIQNKRIRLEHCMFLPTSVIEQTRALNITASFHINHILYYGDFLSNQVIGAERADQIFPVHTFQATGIPFSLHADQPMYEADPLLLASTAVNRKTEDGLAINPKEAISVLDALKSITIHPAWQLHMEHKLGTIENGKYGDFVILDRNPLKVKPEDLGKIKVLETVVAGSTLGVWK